MDIQSLIVDVCAFCGTKLQDVVYDICREYEQMHFNDLSDLVEVEVEVEASESIANFCSKKCQCEGRYAALSAQLVSLPSTRPSVGPIEVCAVCNGVVDMSDWHLTYIESDISGASDQPKQIIDGNDLAVVCKNCVPFRFFTAEKGLS